MSRTDTLDGAKNGETFQPVAVAGAGKEQPSPLPSKPEHGQHFYALRLADLTDEASGNATPDQLRSFKREAEATVRKVTILLKKLP